ncbi:hypothetical protein H4R34_002172 [Dimargaris verticillata]|uniref:Golgi apparatus membrane protein tvp38 n=1 Tax=Dimargaris verticillata TaxID=2761393 RepID=A0A9W8B8G6_9FUNG|nr:hypothetical protein H4R34_002172 [Dimargaris verticillata]
MGRPTKRRKARHGQSALKKLLDLDPDTQRSPLASPTASSSPPLVMAEPAAEGQGDLSFYQVPGTVVCYFTRFLRDRVQLAVTTFLARRDWIAYTVGIALCLTAVHVWDGPHSALLAYVDGVALWYTYWVLLGVASSIGLGAGLHTFVLFLGPHIVEVTLTAYECNHFDFDVRGPNSFVCHNSPLTTITTWGILQKVVWASLFWGAGTAIGELPPYFMARAAALSGRKNPELDALNTLQGETTHGLSLKARALLAVYNMLQRLGFFGIFLFASIPNPLFDLAGITCGHFLVPFPTFFGATFLGKSVVKSTIQTLMVILIFSKDSLDTFLHVLGRILPALHDLVENAIRKQMLALQHKDTPEAHGSDPSDPAAGINVVGLVWNGIIVITLLYFFISIMESCATTALEEETAKAQAAKPLIKSE